MFMEKKSHSSVENFTNNFIASAVDLMDLTLEQVSCYFLVGNNYDILLSRFLKALNFFSW